ncbi:MAG: DUF1905 domain-containing protein [Candidatus Paceibacterota bacterium]|jgi:hypothetical protein
MPYLIKNTEVWLYPGMSGWHFVSLPKKQSEEIKEKFGKKKKGWGAIPVVVTVGETSWKTSIFPDRRAGTYLLPIKAGVRKKEGIMYGDKITFSIKI